MGPYDQSWTLSNDHPDERISSLVLILHQNRPLFSSKKKSTVQSDGQNMPSWLSTTTTYQMTWLQIYDVII